MDTDLASGGQFLTATKKRLPARLLYSLAQPEFWPGRIVSCVPFCPIKSGIQPTISWFRPRRPLGLQAEAADQCLEAAVGMQGIKFWRDFKVNNRRIALGVGTL